MGTTVIAQGARTASTMSRAGRAATTMAGVMLIALLVAGPALADTTPDASAGGPDGITPGMDIASEQLVMEETIHRTGTSKPVLLAQVPESRHPFAGQAGVRRTQVYWLPLDVAHDSIIDVEADVSAAADGHDVPKPLPSASVHCAVAVAQKDKPSLLRSRSGRDYAADESDVAAGGTVSMQLFDSWHSARAGRVWAQLTCSDPSGTPSPTVEVSGSMVVRVRQPLPAAPVTRPRSTEFSVPEATEIRTVNATMAYEANGRPCEIEYRVASGPWTSAGACTSRFRLELPFRHDATLTIEARITTTGTSDTPGGEGERSEVVSAQTIWTPPFYLEQQLRITVPERTTSRYVHVQAFGQHEVLDALLRDPSNTGDNLTCEMRFGNVGGEWFEWIPCNRHATHPLPDEPGQHTIRAQLRLDRTVQAGPGMPLYGNAAIARTTFEPGDRRPDAGYRGWGRVVGVESFGAGGCDFLFAPGGGGSLSCATATVERADAPAWKWTAQGWKRTSPPADGRAFLHPMADGWHWVWTSASGWVAMRTGHLRVAGGG